MLAIAVSRFLGVHGMPLVNSVALIYLTAKGGNFKKE